MTESTRRLTVPRLFIVVPCYNEQEVLPITFEKLSAKLEALVEGGAVAPASRLLFIDDGSTDATWSLLDAAHQGNERFEALRLAHNRGHQNALLAGYEAAAVFCDVAISMDADLQDDVDALDAMLDAWSKGADIVFGVRNDRESDTSFKRGSARAFYHLMRWLGADTVDDHADFRLMDRKALDALAQYGEKNLFLRGLVTDIGLETDVVYYTRQYRAAGESKYPLRKMLSFAFNGVTSFSVKPLRIIGIIGLVVIIFAIIAILYSLCSWIFGEAISGWTTTICSIWFIGGVQLLCIAVLGEYIGRIYSEVKGRPRYFIRQSTLESDDKR